MMMARAVAPIRRATPPTRLRWGDSGAGHSRNLPEPLPARIAGTLGFQSVAGKFPSRIENEYFIVGIVESRVAGFAALKVSSAEIEAVFVAPDTARGLGRQLMADLESFGLASGLRALNLSSSLNAVPFYLALGFAAAEQKTCTTARGWKSPASG